MPYWLYRVMRWPWIRQLARKVQSLPAANAVFTARRVALYDEVAFWRSLMDGTNADQRILNLFQERIAAIKHRRFQRNLEKLATHVPPGAVVRVLDVGCGPVSHVGTCSDRWRIEVVAVDPLADEYRRLREEFDLTDCGVAPMRGEIETLVQIVRERSFDIVYCRNALDHVRDPLSGIRQMIRVLRPGGSCWLEHSSNEGEKQGYRGLHQWNLSPQGDGDLVVWKPDGYRVSLRSELRGAAVVQASDLGGWHTARLLVAA